MYSNNNVFNRVMWSACFLAAISSVTYPAISSFISIHSDADKQGNKLFCYYNFEKINYNYY